MIPQANRAPRKVSVPSGHVRARRPRRTRQGRDKEQPKEVPDLPIPSLVRPPRSRAVAPYTARSEVEDTNLRFLIYHYVTVVSANSVASPGPRFEWYPLCVRDEAFFHAVIASTSSHAAYLQRAELPRSFFAHRGQAIRLLNQRIARGAYDEGTINTIAVFSQQESFEGRSSRCKIHLEGLLQLVKAAGGLHSPGYSAKTRRHILLADLSACIAMDTKPVLAPTLLADLETYYGAASPETASYAKTFAARLYNFTGSSLADQAADVLWGLRNLSARLEAIHDGLESADAAPDELQFSDRVEVLERRVHTLWYVEDPENEQHPLFRTFGWACLIYIYCTLRELPPELGMNALLAGRIKALLEECSYLNVLLATFRDLMLWQMFICGRVADARDRPFFATQATKLLVVQKLKKPVDIIVASEGFLWPERQSGLPQRTKIVLHTLGGKQATGDIESESEDENSADPVLISSSGSDTDEP